MMSVRGALPRVRLEHVGMQDIPSAGAAGLEPATPGLETQQEWLNRAVCLLCAPLCAPVARLVCRSPLRPGETLNRAEWRLIAR